MANIATQELLDPDTTNDWAKKIHEKCLPPPPKTKKKEKKTPPMDTSKCVSTIDKLENILDKMMFSLDLVGHVQEHKKKLNYFNHRRAQMLAETKKRTKTKNLYSGSCPCENSFPFKNAPNTQKLWLAQDLGARCEDAMDRYVLDAILDEMFMSPYGQKGECYCRCSEKQTSKHSSKYGPCGAPIRACTRDAVNRNTSNHMLKDLMAKVTATSKKINRKKLDINKKKLMSFCHKFDVFSNNSVTPCSSRSSVNANTFVSWQPNDVNDDNYSSSSDNMESIANIPPSDLICHNQQNQSNNNNSTSLEGQEQISNNYYNFLNNSGCCQSKKKQQEGPKQTMELTGNQVSVLSTFSDFEEGKQFPFFQKTASSLHETQQSNKFTTTEEGPEEMNEVDSLRFKMKVSTDEVFQPENIDLYQHHMYGQDGEGEEFQDEEIESVESPRSGKEPCQGEIYCSANCSKKKFNKIEKMFLVADYLLAIIDDQTNRLLLQKPALISSVHGLIDNLKKMFVMRLYLDKLNYCTTCLDENMLCKKEFEHNLDFQRIVKHANLAENSFTPSSDSYIDSAENSVVKKPNIKADGDTIKTDYKQFCKCLDADREKEKNVFRKSEACNGLTIEKNLKQLRKQLQTNHKNLSEQELTDAVFRLSQIISKKLCPPTNNCKKPKKKSKSDKKISTRPCNRIEQVMQDPVELEKLIMRFQRNASYPQC